MTHPPWIPFLCSTMNRGVLLYERCSPLSAEYDKKSKTKKQDKNAVQRKNF